MQSCSFSLGGVFFYAAFSVLAKNVFSLGDGEIFFLLS